MLVYRMRKLLSIVIVRKFIISNIIVFMAGNVIAESNPKAPESIENVTIVSAEQLIERLLKNPDLVIIDSRKKAEYMKGHIEGAINILNTRLKRTDLERISPDKSKAILFYCNGARCLRSSDSINKAKGWGYNNLIWFRGGWKEWEEKRLPVITD